jgi:tetratricopeptide (TPR) repeat protein
MKRAEAAQRAADSEETMRQVRRARGFLERAVALDPRDYKSQALLGQVLFNLGERDAAREHLEAALAIEPSGPIAESARRFLQKAQ